MGSPQGHNKGQALRERKGNKQRCESAQAQQGPTKARQARAMRCESSRANRALRERMRDQRSAARAQALGRRRCESAQTGWQSPQRSQVAHSLNALMSSSHPWNNCRRLPSAELRPERWFDFCCSSVGLRIRNAVVMTIRNQGVRPQCMPSVVLVMCQTCSIKGISIPQENVASSWLPLR